MNSQDYEHWRSLCAQFEAAKTAHTDAFNAVTVGFAAPPFESRPTNLELSRYFECSRALQDIKDKMDQFLESHG